MFQKSGPIRRAKYMKIEKISTKFIKIFQSASGADPGRRTDRIKVDQINPKLSEPFFFFNKNIISGEISMINP